MTKLSQRPARPLARRNTPNYARAFLGIGCLMLASACGGSVVQDDPVEDTDAAAAGFGGAAGTGGSAGAADNGGSAGSGYGGDAGFGNSAGGMAEPFDAGEPFDAPAEAESPPPDPSDGGPVCETTETDACSVCAYSSCCNELIACESDTSDPWETKTCEQIWSCAQQCSEGSFVECLTLCDEGNFNTQANDLYNCIHVGQCAGACQ